MKKIFALLLSLAMLVSFASAEIAGLTDFETTDMQGNTVTEEIFAPYDLTMINVWATWCGYCIEEMPYFAELKNTLPENANIITICDDAAAEPELVNQILEASNANYQTLIPTEEMFEQLLAYAYAFPTTFFVNNQGQLLVRPISGVPDPNDPAGAYLTMIETLLEYMEENQ